MLEQNERGDAGPQGVGCRHTPLAQRLSNEYVKARAAVCRNESLDNVLRGLLNGIVISCGPLEVQVALERVCDATARTSIAHELDLPLRLLLVEACLRENVRIDQRHFDIPYALLFELPAQFREKFACAAFIESRHRGRPLRAAPVGQRCGRSQHLIRARRAKCPQRACLVTNQFRVRVPKLANAG